MLGSDMTGKNKDRILGHRRQLRGEENNDIYNSG